MFLVGFVLILCGLLFFGVFVIGVFVVCFVCWFDGVRLIHTLCLIVDDVV